MGLNLPIKHFIYNRWKVWWKKLVKKITVNEIVQIAGRAGRYGHFEAGYFRSYKRCFKLIFPKKFESPLEL